MLKSESRVLAWSRECTRTLRMYPSPPVPIITTSWLPSEAQSQELSSSTKSGHFSARNHRILVGGKSQTGVTRHQFPCNLGSRVSLWLPQDSVSLGLRTELGYRAQTRPNLLSLGVGSLSDPYHSKIPPHVRTSIQSILSPLDPGFSSSPDIYHTGVKRSFEATFTPLGLGDSLSVAPTAQLSSPTSHNPHTPQILGVRVAQRQSLPNSRASVATSTLSLSRHSTAVQGTDLITSEVEDGTTHTGRAITMTGSLSSLDDRKTKRAPLRSSIACFRCRKSKIKCDNQGPTGPCNTCLKAGKECQYPDAAPLPSRRQQALSQVRGEHAGPERERKRVKRAEESGRPEVKDVVRLAEEVLSADYLSATIWSQVFDLYRQHFATELPFLHLASLKERMGSKFRGKASEPSPKTNLVLLGILTLTARFHPDVVNYVANAHVQTAMPGLTGLDWPRSIRMLLQLRTILPRFWSRLWDL